MYHVSRLAISIGAFATASLLMAASPDIGHANGNSNTDMVEKLDLEPAGMRVWLDGTHANPDGCSDPSYYWLPSNGAQFDGQQRILVAALMSGRNVSFWLTGCSDGHPQIFSVRLEQ